MNIMRTMMMGVMVAGLLCPAVSRAEQDKGKSGERWREKMEAKREELFKDLGLSEDQRKALAANKDKNREDAQALRQTMRDQMNQMRQELQKEKLDMAKINQIQSELKEAQAKMLDQRLQGILEVRKILTPEQFKTFSDKMEDHRKQWREHRGFMDKMEKQGDGQELPADVPPPGLQGQNKD